MSQRSTAEAMPSPAPARARRPTVGFLVGNLHLGASRTLWPGVLAAASARDANLICFPGGAIDSEADAGQLRSAAYDLAAGALCDGLVSWASTMTGRLAPDQVAAFHRRYLPLPMVSLSQLLPGVPVVAIDSYQGMRAAVEHLVRVHGCRRLAFLRGPESHFYATERYQAYQDVLSEAGIPLQPSLISGPVAWDSGPAAIRELLDRRHLQPGRDFEAVVAVSDLLALAALDELLRRGVRVPRDVAVVGFNDQPEGRYTTPPLTSVALPFYEQGFTAVDTLLAQIHHQPVPQQLTLACRLEIRQSCGCPARSVRLAGAMGDPAAVARPKSARLPQHAHLATDLGDEAGMQGIAAERLDSLVEALAHDSEEDSGRRFLLQMEDLLAAAGADAFDPSCWQNALSRLRAGLLPFLSPVEQTRVEALCGQARVMVAEAGERRQGQRHLAAQAQADRLRELGQHLITAFDLQRLGDILAEQLPAAGIRSGYLVLHEEPGDPVRGARLRMAFTERGRDDLGPSGRPLAPGLLLPAGLLPWWRRFSLVVEPLFVGTEPLGFALFEIGPVDGAVYEVLRGQVSSAVKGALLFREAQEARLAAEKADRMKSRLLANVTHELRAPLNIILSHTHAALESADPYNVPAAHADLRHIQHSAEHQLRVINDLLDLSRAEINELDLYPELFDPRGLLEETFQDMARRPSPADDVSWQLQLPDRLPMLQADRVRLRQVLLNLLSNAAKFTRSGEILLGADVAPPHLHLWVKDSGIGIPADEQDRIFEPFVTGVYDDEQMAGIGLGLSITRRLVALHGGVMRVDSRPGAGSTFHVYLPLPSLSEPAAAPAADAQPILLLIAGPGDLAPEIAEFSRRLGLAVTRAASVAEIEHALSEGLPSALACDLGSPGVGFDAAALLLTRQLRNHPRLGRLPVILYGQGWPGTEGGLPGITGFLLKPAAGQTLLDAVAAAYGPGGQGPILVVDDEQETRESYRQVIGAGLPGCAIRTAAGSREALTALAQEVPGLVILDLMMPGMDGFDVLERLRADPRTRRVPVLILSSRSLDRDDVKRLQAHALVTFQSKGVLSDDETTAAVRRALSGAAQLPPQTSALVKSAIAYLQQNYARPVARWEVAEAAGTSEDYLTNIFRRELGLTPWDYLNRYRVAQAKTLLGATTDSISSIAARVGLKDQAYFSRVFRKVTGMSPQEYRRLPAGPHESAP